MTPLKAIKLFCVECMGGERSQVDFCTAPGCPLFRYRKGKGNIRRMTDEQRKAASERMHKMWENRG